MDEFELNKIKIELENISDNYHLSKLSKVLNFQMSSSILFLLSFFGSVFLFFAFSAALLFIPYLNYVLWVEKRRLWLVIFYVLIILPIIITFILIPAYTIYTALVSLSLFYGYCYVLRLSVNEWIKQNNWKRKFLEDKLNKNFKDNN